MPRWYIHIYAPYYLQDLEGDAEIDVTEKEVKETLHGVIQPRSQGESRAEKTLPARPTLGGERPWERGLNDCVIASVALPYMMFGSWN